MSFLCFLLCLFFFPLISRDIHYTTLSPLKLDGDADLTTRPLQPHHFGATDVFVMVTSWRRGMTGSFGCFDATIFTEYLNYRVIYVKYGLVLLFELPGLCWVCDTASIWMQLQMYVCWKSEKHAHAEGEDGGRSKSWGIWTALLRLSTSAHSPSG